MDDELRKQMIEMRSLLESMEENLKTLRMYAEWFVSKFNTLTPEQTRKLLEDLKL
jgi:archaellum component FlaC